MSRVATGSEATINLDSGEVAGKSGRFVIDKELLPLMREALETAWARGFLQSSKAIEDYHIGRMNMGWELPGTFDVDMQERNLSFKVKSRIVASD